MTDLEPVRSIQLHLHAFFAALDPDSSAVSPSSWCEARLKLRHTAFIELNERAILEVVYGANSSFAVRRWNGHRAVHGLAVAAVVVGILMAVVIAAGVLVAATAPEGTF